MLHTDLIQLMIWPQLTASIVPVDASVEIQRVGNIWRVVVPIV